jgi:hypothetical protein
MRSLGFQGLHGLPGAKAIFMLGLQNYSGPSIFLAIVELGFQSLDGPETVVTPAGFEPAIFRVKT